MKKTAVVTVAALALTGSLLFAAKPVRNINPNRHPNLAEAQNLSRRRRRTSGTWTAMPRRRRSCSIR